MSINNCRLRIAVVGIGYVGLISGVCLAAKGHTVTCVDVRGELVERLNRRQPLDIYESGLPELLKRVQADGRFRATISLDQALANCDLVLVTVGTPSDKGRIDLTIIRQSIIKIGYALKAQGNFLPIVIKSTVIPGTTDTILRRDLEESSGKLIGDFGLGMNPEFLREGSAITDFMEPDRIVLGYEDLHTLDLMQAMYEPWSCIKLAVPTRTAEFIKYANNCLLATLISATNELANLASSLGGIDIAEVMKGVHLDKRWSPLLFDGTRIKPEILTYLKAGSGFGGSCFPKDVQALRSQGEDLGLSMKLLNAVLEINYNQPKQVIDLLKRKLKGIEGCRVLVLGLSFKPNTDDVRESSSYCIIEELLMAGAVVTAHDPHAVANFRLAWPGLSCRYVASWVEELSNADAVVVATGWPEYNDLRKPSIKLLLNGKILIDPRRLFEPSDFPESSYCSIGLSEKIDVD
jgi:UDPglucose 6-dehydrogenase